MKGINLIHINFLEIYNDRLLFYIPYNSLLIIKGRNLRQLDCGWFPDNYKK